MSTLTGTHTAAILTERGKPLTLTQQPIPAAVHGTAIIRVLAAAISPNTQLFISGASPISTATPITPSAPAVARIHALGPDATTLRPGQLVLVDFWDRSRDDPDVSILQGYIGGPGDTGAFERVWEHGTYAEYARVPLENVWAMNEDVVCGSAGKGLGYSTAELAYLASVCVPLAGLLDVNVKAGDTVVVAPATGYFGGSAVQAALALGARVVACGRNEGTLGRMRDVFEGTGRFETVRMSGDGEVDTKAVLGKCANVKGADVYIDFTPPQGAGSSHIVSCINALRPYGSMVIMGGVFGEVSVPYFATMRKNLRLQGRYMFDRWHGEQAVKLLESGHLKLGPQKGSGIEVESFPLARVSEAVDRAAEKAGWGSLVVLQP